jgi:hypothetical protein
MSNDEISAARGIGSRISRGTGSIRIPIKKKREKEEGVKKVKSSRVSTEKPDKNIIDAEIVDVTPVKVKSERINMPKEITTGQKQITAGEPERPIAQPQRTVGRQFKEYAGLYGTDTQPAVDLSKL